MTQTQAASPPVEPSMGGIKRLADWALDLDYRGTFRVWIAWVQWIYIASIVWVSRVPETNGGILTLIKRDFDVDPGVMALPFLIATGLAFRGTPARYRYLGVLLGQAAYAAATLLYFLKGGVGVTGLAAHGMLFVIHAIAIWGMAQDAAAPERQVKPRWRAQSLLMPALSVSLALYAAGIAFSRDTALGLYIQVEYGVVFKAFLGACLGWGAGYIAFNHIAAPKLFLALLPQYTYSLIVVALLRFDQTTSLVGVLTNLAFSITSIFIVLIQVQEYEEER